MTESTSDPDPFTWRFRLVACCLVLVALAFSQRPGRLVGDTKLDLVVDPAAFLERSLHLWDPGGGFGQVQNQAYGYLFPMGPFFWLGDRLGVPDWAVQRAWWSLLLVVAFLGVVKLSGALGLGTPTSRVVAGFAYALSPRILTLLGPISIEAWPSALAPWVLVPLVIGARRGSPRRAALLSALAVAAVGGVNAAATFAVVPLGVVWLLTRQPGPRRRSLMTWWPLFVAAGTAWWVVPLLLLGRYSPPFLDYIETAEVTTFPTTVFDVLRGTSHWVPYVDATWQAGNDLLTTSYVALNTGALLLFGVVGTVLRRNPHRGFLVISVLLGLLMVSAGHGGEVTGWFAGTERAALDGALAPLRNVHKFDPLVRLPLVLGLAHLLAVLADRAGQASTADREHPDSPRSSELNGDRLAYAGALLLSVASVIGIAGPAFAGRLGPANDFEAVPAYWASTAAWLDENSGGTTALLVPGSSFATYVWGDPDDEPLQPLTSSSWAVRNAVPLAPAGNIRALDAIEEQLASGRPSAGLAGYLRRAGVGHLVVRNDLRGGEPTAPVLVHQVLDGSPGIRRVADFGPDVGSDADVGGSKDPAIVDRGWTAPYPAVEIYEVAGAQRAVATSSSPPVVVGGPESLLELLETDLIDDTPSILAVDAPQDIEGSRVVLTDGLRRSERNFARILDATSPTWTEGEDARRGAPARDYTVGGPRWETSARYLGARDITASSSQAFADGPGPSVGEYLPFAAFDGFVSTRWEAEDGDSAPWLSVRLDAPQEVRSVVVVVGERGGESDERDERIRVVTDVGVSEPVSAIAGQPVTVVVPPGVTSRVRVVRDAPADEPFSLSEVRVPGVDIDRTLVVPSVPASWGAPDSILLSSVAGWRSACVRVDGDVRCDPDRARLGEEPGALDRTLRLGTGASYSVRTQVVPVDGSPLQGLVQRDQLLNALASSAAVDDVRASAVAAVDGDVGTTWTAGPDDDDPTLSLSWIGARTVRGLDIRLDSQAPASPPTRVEIEYPGGRQVVELDATGRVRVEPFRAERVDLRLETDESVADLGSGAGEGLPVGVSEVRLDGLDLLPVTLSEQRSDIGCQFGPTVRLGDAFYPTSVTASPRELFDGGLLDARLCGPERVEVSAGETRAVVSPAPAFRPARLLLTQDAGAAAEPPQVVAPVDLSGSPVSRLLRLPPIDASLVAVRENANPGWVASSVDGEVEPVTVDGWQQGWRLDGQEPELDVTYTPDRVYRAALALGAVLLLLMVAGLSFGRTGSPGGAPALAARALSRPVAAAAGLAVFGLVGSWWGVAIGGAALASTMLALGRRVPPSAAAWSGGALVGSAALFYWWRPLGSAEGWAGTLALPQLLVLAGLGVLVALTPGGKPGTASRQRIAGSSTKR